MYSHETTYLNLGAMMFVRGIALLLLSAIAVHAQAPVPRDAVSLAILKLLARNRSTVTVSAQIHHAGDPDGQVDPIQFNIDASSASTLVDETNQDGTHTRSILFQSQRIYSDGRQADTLNSSYLFLPQFDLADELADPSVSVDVGRSAPGQVTIRVHTVHANGVAYPGDVDKSYVVDTTLHQIVAVKSQITVGVYQISHELRYSSYQAAGSGGIQVPSAIAEYLGGEQLWQLNIISVQ
jgi:hypothetical protein